MNAFSRLSVSMLFVMTATACSQAMPPTSDTGRIAATLTVTSDMTSTGFFWPIGTNRTGSYSGWLNDSCAWSGNQSYFANEYHLGKDIAADEGSPVYAISAGTVFHVSSNGWGMNNLALLVVHELSDKSVFTAVYGHIRSNLQKGDQVEAGQSIGTVGPWAEGSHLHFGVRPGTSTQAPYGRMPCPIAGPIVDSNGFVDPVEWITTKSPGTGPLSDALNRPTATTAAANPQADGPMPLTFHLPEQAISVDNADQVMELARLSTNFTQRIGNRMAIAPNGAALAVAGFSAETSDQVVWLWALRTGDAKMVTFDGRVNPGRLVFSQDGARLALDSARQIIVVDVDSGQELYSTPDAQDYFVADWEFSADGTILVVAGKSGSDGDGEVKFYDATSGAELQTISGFSGGVNDLALSPNKRWLAVAFNGGRNAEAVELSTGRRVGSLSGIASYLSFSPDSLTLFVGNSQDWPAALWEFSTTSEVALRATITATRSIPVRAPAFSPDSTLVPLGSDDGVMTLYSVTDGRALAVFAGHQDWIWSLDFSPDGRLLATVSKDGTARLWEAATGRELNKFPEIGEGVLQVRFASDGKYLLTASDGSGEQVDIRVWGIP